MGGLLGGVINNDDVGLVDLEMRVVSGNHTEVRTECFGTSDSPGSAVQIVVSKFNVLDSVITSSVVTSIEVGMTDDEIDMTGVGNTSYIEVRIDIEV